MPKTVAEWRADLEKAEERYRAAIREGASRFTISRRRNLMLNLREIVCRLEVK